MSPIDRGLVGAASFLLAVLAVAGAAAVGFAGWSLVATGAGATGAASIVLLGLRSWTDQKELATAVTSRPSVESRLDDAVESAGVMTTLPPEEERLYEALERAIQAASVAGEESLAGSLRIVDAFWHAGQEEIVEVILRRGAREWSVCEGGEG